MSARGRVKKMTDTDEVMLTLYKIDELDIPAEEPFVETLTINGLDQVLVW